MGTTRPNFVERTLVGGEICECFLPWKFSTIRYICTLCIRKDFLGHAGNIILLPVDSNKEGIKGLTKKMLCTGSQSGIFHSSPPPLKEGSPFAQQQWTRMSSRLSPLSIWPFPPAISSPPRPCSQRPRSLATYCRQCCPSANDRDPPASGGIEQHSVFP